jgi:hypothetical protein
MSEAPKYRSASHQSSSRKQRELGKADGYQPRYSAGMQPQHQT